VIWNDALVNSRELCASDEKTSYPLLAKLWITQAKPTPERPWLADASTMVLQQLVCDLDLASTARWLSCSRWARRWAQGVGGGGGLLCCPKDVRIKSLQLFQDCIRRGTAVERGLGLVAGRHERIDPGDYFLLLRSSLFVAAFG